MKKYTALEIHERMTSLGITVPIDFHLVGIRSKASVPDKFDDHFYIIKERSIVGLSPYDCTTNPGEYWLKNLLNPKGAALLVADRQYPNSWQIGTHKGYEALVQCRPVLVYRDADKDEFAEETSTIDTGMFGINIHRANENLKSLLIGKWSAGCHVIANPADFKSLLFFCKQSGKGQFTYTLLKEW